MVTGTLIDYYGNAVCEADVQISATGASQIDWEIAPGIFSDDTFIGETNNDGQINFRITYYQGVCSAC